MKHAVLIRTERSCKSLYLFRLLVMSDTVLETSLERVLDVFLSEFHEIKLYHRNQKFKKLSFYDGIFDLNLMCKEFLLMFNYLQSYHIRIGVVSLCLG